MWVIIFWLKPECVIETVELLKVKLIKYYAYYTETAFERKD